MMSKALAFSIGIILFFWNRDLVNAFPGIPKTYKGKEVNVLSTRDSPPSRITPYIRHDNGTREYLNVEDFYPYIKETGGKGWGKVVAQFWPRRYDPSEDFYLTARRTLPIEQINESIAAAFNKILNDFFTLFWAERTRDEIIDRVMNKLREDEPTYTVPSLSYRMKRGLFLRRLGGADFSTLQYLVPHYG